MAGGFRIGSASGMDRLGIGSIFTVLVYPLQNRRARGHLRMMLLLATAAAELNKQALASR